MPGRREGLSPSGTWRKTIPGTGNRKMLRGGAEFGLFRGLERGQCGWSIGSEGVCKQWGRVRPCWALPVAVILRRNTQHGRTGCFQRASTWAVPCISYLDSCPRDRPWQGPLYCKSMCFTISYYSSQAVNIRWAVENLGAQPPREATMSPPEDIRGSRAQVALVPVLTFLFIQNHSETLAFPLAAHIALNLHHANQH